MLSPPNSHGRGFEAKYGAIFSIENGAVFKVGLTENEDSYFISSSP